MLSKDYSKRITLKDGSTATLRFPNEGDIQNILDCVNALVEEDTYFLVTKKTTYERQKEFLTPVFKAIEDSRAFMLYAFADDKVLGWMNANEVSPRSPHVRELGIALLKEARGKGLGEILMLEGMKLAKEWIGCELFTLQVAEQNEPARNLYRKLGFIESGIVPNAVKYGGERMGQVTMYKFS